MGEIVLHAYITEENRYDFTVKVKDYYTKAEEIAEAKEKLNAFLECNTPCVFHRGEDEFSDVMCDDAELSVGSSVKELTKIYHDKDESSPSKITYPVVHMEFLNKSFSWNSGLFAIIDMGGHNGEYYHLCKLNEKGEPNLNNGKLEITITGIGTEYKNVTKTNLLLIF